MVAMNKGPNELITEIESLRAQIDDTKFSSPMTERDFLVHVLNNLPEVCDTAIDGLESRLSKSDSEELIIEDAQHNFRNDFNVTKDRWSSMKAENK